MGWEACWDVWWGCGVYGHVVMAGVKGIPFSSLCWCHRTHECWRCWHSLFPLRSALGPYVWWTGHLGHRETLAPDCALLGAVRPLCLLTCSLFLPLLLAPGDLQGALGPWA